MRVPTELEKAWMAGFVDGEGCINIHIKHDSRYNCSRFHTTIEITQVQAYVLELFVDIYGGSLKWYKRKASNSRIAYYWYCPRLEQKRMLLDLYPHLRLKNKQATLVLDYFEAVPKIDKWKTLPVNVVMERQKLHDEMRKLNHRGLEMVN